MTQFSQSRLDSIDIAFYHTRLSYNRRKITNQIMLIFTGILTSLALLPLVWIISYVVYKGGQYLSLDFFTQMPKPLGMEGGGVLHAIEGTIILTVLGGVIAIPPALLAAIYAAYHSNTILGIAVRFGTDVLSGVPSIIVGLFVYALVVKNQGHYSALAGGIALAIIIFPTIVRTTEEMIKLTPRTLREGSLALGAPEWKTTLSVTLVAAANGIVTGILLGLARASGETAPLLFTALGNENYEIGKIISSGVANRQGLLAILNRIFEQPVDSLPLTLWKYAQQPYPERISQSWAAALVLMILILVLNIATRIWLQRRMSRLQGR
ncbi:MAG: phosphate ABC transporter permease PstA [Chloroflexi bacterium]|nr:phosphate ABC transporter permease PstA [Chloroflexota bacterium]